MLKCFSQHHYVSVFKLTNGHTTTLDSPHDHSHHQTSPKTAKWIRSNVPGIHIPDSVIARLEGAQDQKKEGKQLCIDIINEVKEIEGVSGVHVMAYRQEEYVAEIVHESGVLKGRKPWTREPNPVDTLVAERLEEARAGKEQNQQEMAEIAAQHPH